jgi:DNA-binding MarR family transcriptional regulator
LKRAAQFAADVYMEHAGKDGLTQRQFTVLTVVDANEGVSQTQLVKLTGIDRSTLADMVSRLTAQGYLKRKRSKDDARINIVGLTAAGRKALSAVQPNAAAVDRKIMAEIPKENRKLFLDMLQMLADKSSDLEDENGSK